MHPVITVEELRKSERVAGKRGPSYTEVSACNADVMMGVGVDQC